MANRSGPGEAAPLPKLKSLGIGHLEPPLQVLRQQ